MQRGECNDCVVGLVKGTCCSPACINLADTEPATRHVLCSGCGVVSYCCRACLQVARPVHSLVCGRAYVKGEAMDWVKGSRGLGLK